MRAQEAVGQRLVFAQQPQQQVLGFYIRRAELAGLIPRKEDHAPCLLRIPFEHDLLLPATGVSQAARLSSRPAIPPASTLRRAPFPLLRRRRPQSENPRPEQLFWMVPGQLRRSASTPAVRRPLAPA